MTNSTMTVMVSIIRFLTNSSTKHSDSRARYKAQQLKQSTAIFLDATIRSTNIQRRQSLKILRHIIKHTEREILQYIPEKQMILECSLVLVQAYVAHLKLGRGFFDRFRKQPFVSAKKCFQSLIYLLIPERQDMVIDTILNFLQRENLWKVEFICDEILTMVLECKSPASLLLYKIVNYVESLLAKNDVPQARHTMTVLQNIIQPQYWDEIQHSDISKLLRFYHSSAVLGESKNQIYELRRGFEICLRNLIRVIKPEQLIKLLITMLPLTFDTTLSDETMLEFGTTVEFAASTLTLSEIPSQEEMFVQEYLLSHIRSETASKSILASRIYAKMLDRGRNFLEFNTPKVFHEGTYYDIDINQYNPAQRHTFEDHRREFTESLTIAIEYHSQRRTNLEVFYNVICMVLVEIPCGYTACAVVCLLLGIQRRLLESSTRYTPQQTNRIHATFISIMTLINWIHRGSSLTSYVNTVLNRRFDNAPHLNPPLKEIYEYAQHHVTWNNETLFFDALEMRYGLWKCFRINEPKSPAPQKIYSRLGGGRKGKARRQSTGYYKIGL
ncbi:uncharacterized protein LOC134219963 [Armigeres subalbatus]|uniref:uncharacterized protein LOC134219963 n=1 Tax=Armigeres subalbatus TaxID=124917 RepID=UPI002ED029E6